jgi:SAM-dependent methyltransferase
LSEPGLKEQVRTFWEAGACGEVYASGASRREQFDAHARARYALEPYIHDFARFHEGRGRDVLEIGVGMGADHLQWAQAGPSSLTGVDLTKRALDLCGERLALHGCTSRLMRADAERLRFDDESFDIVYSWGVLHHTPDTRRAIREVHRVLRPGGVARVMVYHSRSVVGSLLWLRYALLAGRPGRSLADVYAEHLESPGTKAYSIEEAQALFAPFRSVKCSLALSPGDVLAGAAGQRHPSLALRVSRRLWPGWFIRRYLQGYGLFLLVEAVK